MLKILLYKCSRCVSRAMISVLRLFLLVLWVGLLPVIVAFSGHNYLLFSLFTFYSSES